MINIGISETIEGKKLVKWKTLKTQLTSYLHYFVKNGASLIIIFYHISRFSWLRRCMLGFAKGQFIVAISKVAIKKILAKAPPKDCSKIASILRSPL